MFRLVQTSPKWQKQVSKHVSPFSTGFKLVLKDFSISLVYLFEFSITDQDRISYGTKESIAVRMRGANGERTWGQGWRAIELPSKRIQLSRRADLAAGFRAGTLDIWKTSGRITALKRITLQWNLCMCPALAMAQLFATGSRTTRLPVHRAYVLSTWRA